MKRLEAVDHVSTTQEKVGDMRKIVAFNGMEGIDMKVRCLHQEQGKSHVADSGGNLRQTW